MADHLDMTFILYLTLMSVINKSLSPLKSVINTSSSNILKPSHGQLTRPKTVTPRPPRSPSGYIIFPTTKPMRETKEATTMDGATEDAAPGAGSGAGACATTVEPMVATTTTATKAALLTAVKVEAITNP